MSQEPTFKTHKKSRLNLLVEDQNLYQFFLELQNELEANRIRKINHDLLMKELISKVQIKKQEQEQKQEQKLINLRLQIQELELMLKQVQEQEQKQVQVQEQVQEQKQVQQKYNIIWCPNEDAVNRCLVFGCQNKHRRVKCLYFEKDNYCSRGRKCNFIHKVQSSVPCYFYNNGKCFKGELCSFSHNVAISHDATVSHDATIKHCKFGINCLNVTCAYKH